MVLVSWTEHYHLPQDNNCEDPHGDLVMSKKALSLFQDEEEQSQRRTKRKVNIRLDLLEPKPPQVRTTEYYKQRFRKNLSQLLEEEAGDLGEEVSGFCAVVLENVRV